MAQCSNCSSELAEGARICQVCGSPVQAQPAQPQGWERQPTGEPQPQAWQPQGQPGGPQGAPPPPPYPGAGSQPGQGGSEQSSYGQPGYGYGPPQQFPGGYAPPRTDGQAIAALVCGIIGIVACPIIFSVIAIVLGRQSERRVKESGGTLTGDQMAKAGWILGIIGLVVSALFLVLVVFGVFSSMMVGGF